jgi:hypothetical protein
MIKLRNLVKESKAAPLKYNTEYSFFNDIKSSTKGGKAAVEEMQEIDPEIYDSPDLQDEYQQILDKHKIPLTIKSLRIKADGSVTLSTVSR